MQHESRINQAGSIVSERAQADLAHAHEETTQLWAECALLIQQLATAIGKIGAQGEQLESLERRAFGAETRLEEALKRLIIGRKS